MEISNLLEKEFRITIVKMVQDLKKIMEAKIEKMQEMFTKDLDDLKNKQTEINKTLGGTKSRITEAEEWISDMKDRMVKITATEHRKKNEKKKKRRRHPKRPLGQH